MRESITVYSKEDCPYCVRAKSLLNERNIEFREVLVDTSDHCVVAELQDKTGMKTFPQIFVGNTVLGGFTELQELDAKTGLKHL